MMRRALLLLPLALTACGDDPGETHGEDAWVDVTPQHDAAPTDGTTDGSQVAPDGQLADAAAPADVDGGPDGSDAGRPDGMGGPDATLPDATASDGTTAPDAADSTAGDAVAPTDAPDTEADTDGGAVPPTLNLDALPLAAADYPLGVQAADPTASGALLWTRHDGWGPVRWYVVADGPADAPAPVVASGGPIEDLDGFVVVPVEGLEPATAHHYVFTNDVPPDSPEVLRSPIGRFVTAPTATDLLPVTVGATSCVDISQAPLAPLAAAAEEPLDLFVWLGDTVYADGAHNLDEYRDFWTESYATPEYRALHAATGHTYTWDDHEVENNWDPEKVDPGQLAAATQAFFEHAPMRHDEEAPGRICRSLRWGATLEVFVLDCRSERLPSTKDTDAAQYISPEQLAWLVDGVQGSDAVFKLIANSVPITNMPPIYIGDDDRWEGYDAQRDTVLEAIGEVPGVVWLAGDFHFASVNGIEPPDKPLGDVWEILAGPGAKLQNPAWLVIGEGLFKDQFLWLDGTNNTVRLRFDPFPDVPTMTVEFVDGGGEVLHSQVLGYPQ